jgi:hypothetical protein
MAIGYEIRGDGLIKKTNNEKGQKILRNRRTEE